MAPDSIASIYGVSLSSQTAQAGVQPPPLSLGGVTLTVQDAAGTVRTAPLMYVSSGLINFVIPDGTVPGAATFTVTTGITAITAAGSVQTVAPTLFSAAGTGTGVAAATALRVQAANPQLQSPVQVFQCNVYACAATPIDLGLDTPVYLTLYGTGIRNRSSLFKCDGDDRRRQRAGAVCGSATHVRGARSGERLVAADTARKRGIERSAHSRWAEGEHGHCKYSVNRPHGSNSGRPPLRNQIERIVPLH